MRVIKGNPFGILFNGSYQYLPHADDATIPPRLKAEIGIIFLNLKDVTMKQFSQLKEPQIPVTTVSKYTNFENTEFFDIFTWVMF